ncbi:MAG TPA: hypothetical protein VIT22_03605 [Pseudoxanthomonas sp.]
MIRQTRLGTLPSHALASVLSACGLGLLIWLGISIAMLQGRSAELAALRSMQQSGLMIACVLALAGIVNMRVPAGGKWRRVGMMALAMALVFAVAVMRLLAGQRPDPGWLFMASALMSIGAVTAVLAAGMAMAASGRQSWRSQMVAPNFLAFALLAGATLLFALIAMKWPGQDLLSAPTPSLVMLVVVVAALKLLYWFENGGLHARVAVLSDKDAPWLRLAALALLALFPLLLTGILALWPQLVPRAGWCLIALSVVAGGCLERRLLAAEAGYPVRDADSG